MKTRGLKIKEEAFTEKLCAGYCAQEFFQENYFEHKGFSEKLFLEKVLSILEKSVLLKSFRKINFELKNFRKSCARNILIELAKFLENAFEHIFFRPHVSAVKVRARKF